MKVSLLLCLVVAASLLVAAEGFKEGFMTKSPNGFGDRLLRTFLLFKQQPLTMQQATSHGNIQCLS